MSGNSSSAGFRFRWLDSSQALYCVGKVSFWVSVSVKQFSVVKTISKPNVNRIQYTET